MDLSSPSSELPEEPVKADTEQSSKPTDPILSSNDVSQLSFFNYSVNIWTLILIHLIFKKLDLQTMPLKNIMAKASPNCL
jgi:hypothetical protein